MWKKAREIRTKRCKYWYSFWFFLKWKCLNNQENTSNIKENEQSNTNKRVLKAIDSINLRKSPTTNEDNYITEIPKDSEVNVYEQVSDENGDMWSKIDFNGNEGYVRSDLLTEIN